MHSTFRLRGLLAQSACLLLGALCPTQAQTPAPTGLAAIVKGSLGTTVQKVLAADNKTANTWADGLDKSGLATPDLSAKQKELLTTFVTDVADYKACLARAYRLMPLEEPDRDDKLKGQGYGDNTPWDDADAGFRRIIAAESASETPNSPDFFGSTAFQNYHAALFAKADALKNLRDLMTLAGDAAGDRKALEDYAAGAGVLTVSKEAGAKYSVISDAVKAADAGSLIQVGPGTYAEEISITKPLVLMGPADSSTCIIERKEESSDHQNEQCLHIRSVYAEVDKISLQEHNSYSYAVDNGGGNAVLRDCIVNTDSESGALLIHQEPRSSLSLYQCLVQYPGKTDTRPMDWNQTATLIADGTRFRICGGIPIHSGSLIRNCRVEGNGAYLNVFGNGVVTNTIISGHVAMYGGAPLIQNCVINSSFRANIVDEDAHATLIDDNISGGDDGGFAPNSYNVGCLHAASGSDVNIVHCKIASDRTIPVVIDTGTHVHLQQCELHSKGVDIVVPFGENPPVTPHNHVYTVSIATSHEPGENGNTISLANKMFDKALDAERQHQYRSAENLLRHGLRLSEFSTYFRVLARVQSAQGNYSDAIKTLQAWLLLVARVDTPEGYGIDNRVMLVDLLLKTGRRAEALNAAKETIAYAAEAPHGNVSNDDDKRNRDLSKYHSFQVLGLFPMKQSGTSPHAPKHP